MKFETAIFGWSFRCRPLNDEPEQKREIYLVACDNQYLFRENHSTVSGGFFFYYEYINY